MSAISRAARHIFIPAQEGSDCYRRCAPTYWSDVLRLQLEADPVVGNVRVQLHCVAQVDTLHSTRLLMRIRVLVVVVTRWL